MSWEMLPASIKPVCVIFIYLSIPTFWFQTNLCESLICCSSRVACACTYHSVMPT